MFSFFRAVTWKVPWIIVDTMKLFTISESMDLMVTWSNSLFVIIWSLKQLLTSGTRWFLFKLFFYILVDVSKSVRFWISWLVIMIYIINNFRNVHTNCSQYIFSNRHSKMVLLKNFVRRYESMILRWSSGMLISLSPVNTWRSMDIFILFMKYNFLFG